MATTQKDKMKLFKTLTESPEKWFKITSENEEAFEGLQSDYGTSVFQFDGFSNSMRYIPINLNVWEVHLKD